MTKSATPSAETLAERIRRLRKRLGLTQTELAERMGVSFASINRWENGHVEPLPAFIRELEKLEREAESE